MRGLVADVQPLLYTTPAHIQGNARGYLCSPYQGINDVAIIINVKVRKMERGFPRARINAHVVPMNARYPKEAVRGDARVEIVYLIDQTLVSEEVQSEEGKGALTVLPIYSNVLAFHETHVRCPEQRGRSTRHRS